MQKETLQSLLKQISQERVNAVELKEKKDQEFLDSLKQGIKDFIETFRKEFYPLISEDIDPSSIGGVFIEHAIGKFSSYQPNVIRLRFDPYWKDFTIKFYGTMLGGTLFEEKTNEPKENIIENLSYESELKKYSKELYEFFVEGKEELIQKAYDEIHKNILRYNQRTIEITESLK